MTCCVLHVFCSWGLRDSLKGREEVTNKLGGFPAEYTRYLLSSYIHSRFLLFSLLRKLPSTDETRDNGDHEETPDNEIAR